MDDTISRQAAIDALEKDMASLDHIIKGMSANDVRLDAYVSQRNQVNYDIYTINNLPPVQPEQLGTNLAEVGTDCISRQEAISAICNACGKIDCDKMDKCEKLQLSPANISETPNSSDTISRQQAIDAVQNRHMMLSKENVLLINDLEKLPPAEPQIIRCKDCKNWDTTWTNDFSPNYHYCPMVDGVRKEDWFCADAERRTE